MAAAKRQTKKGEKPMKREHRKKSSDLEWEPQVKETHPLPD